MTIAISDNKTGHRPRAPSFGGCTVGLQGPWRVLFGLWGAAAGAIWYIGTLAGAIWVTSKPVGAIWALVGAIWTPAGAIWSMDGPVGAIWAVVGSGECYLGPGPSALVPKP